MSYKKIDLIRSKIVSLTIFLTIFNFSSFLFINICSMERTVEKKWTVKLPKVINFIKDDKIAGNLNLSETETFSQDSFNDLIKMDQNESSPVLIAKVNSIDLLTGKTFTHYFDGTNYLINLTKDADNIFSPTPNRYTSSDPCKFKNILNNMPIYGPIEFYKLRENKFEYTYSDQDLFKSKEVTPWINFWRNKRFLRDYIAQRANKFFPESFGVFLENLIKNDLIDSVKTILDSQLLQNVNLDITEKDMKTPLLKTLIESASKSNLNEKTWANLAELLLKKGAASNGRFDLIKLAENLKLNLIANSLRTKKLK